MQKWKNIERMDPLKLMYAFLLEFIGSFVRFDVGTIKNSI